MKKLIVLVWILAGGAGASIDFKSTTDLIGLSGQVADTSAINTYQIADSVRIVTTFHGMECIDAWYNAGDAEADSSNGILTWYDAVGDIDADSGAGLYTVTAMFYDANLGLYQNRHYEFYLGTQSVNVATVSNDAIDLTTDVCNVLPDSNIADITVGSVTGAVGSVTGAVGSVTGAVGSVTGNVGGNVTGTVASVVGNVGGNVTGSVGSVTGAVGSVTGNVGGNVTGSVGSVTGAVGSVTAAVTVGAVDNDAINLFTDVTGQLLDSNVADITVGSVTGAVGSVTGSVGSVTGAVGSVTGAVGSVTGAVGSVTGAVGSVTAAVTVGAVNNDAINLFTDVTGQLLDSNLQIAASVTKVRDTTNAILASPGLDTSLFGFAEDVWTNIDTAATIDTSLIGKWLATNVAASSTDTTVIKALATGNPALFYGPTDVNATQISGDATAANNLETMLDGTGGATLSLGRLAISGANSTNGSVSIANSSGTGIIATGTTAGASFTGSAGNGATFTGGTNGHGMALAGAGTGEGLSSTGGGTAGHGAQFIAGTAGTGMYLLGSTTGAGMDIYGGTSGHGVLIASGSAAANDGVNITGQDDGVVMTGAAGNGLQIAGAGGILDVNVEFDSANFASETFDSAHFTDKFFTEAQGAAAGIDSGVVTGAAKAALGAGDFIWRAKQFIIKTDGSANDTAAFAVHNTSASSGDYAVHFGAVAGAGFSASSSSNSAVRWNVAGGSNPTFWITNTSSGTGEAFKAEITGSNNPNQAVEFSNTSVGSGFKVTADDTAAAMVVYNSDLVHATPTAGAGEGLMVTSEHGNAVTFHAGGTAAAQENFGFEVEGNTYFHGREGNNEAAVWIHSDSIRSALVIWPDTVDDGGYGAPGVRISGDTGMYIPGGIMATIDSVRGGGGGGSDTTAILRALIDNKDSLGSADTVAIIKAAQNNPSYFYGPTGTGLGSGLYAVTVYAIDTLGTDSALADVHITARDASGGLTADGTTSGSGYVTFKLDAANYVLLARRAGYSFNLDTITVSGAVTDSVKGYNSVAENTCLIYGYIGDGKGNYVSGAVVTAVLEKEKVYDTCAGMLITNEPIPSNKTGTDGLWEIELVWSSCLKGEKYLLTMSKPRQSDVRGKKVEIPDSTTYFYEWGN